MNNEQGILTPKQFFEHQASAILSKGGNSVTLSVYKLAEDYAAYYHEEMNKIEKRSHTINSTDEFKGFM